MDVDLLFSLLGVFGGLGVVAIAVGVWARGPIIYV